MKLPEDIDIATVLHFDQNHDLDFDFSHPASRELAESLAIQDAIEEDYESLEKRYNAFAFAHNELWDQDNTNGRDNVRDAFLLARTTLYSSGMINESESTAQQHVGKWLLTRVIFSEIVEGLYNDLPDVHTFEETNHVDFVSITREADMDYMFTDHLDDEEY